MVPTVSSHQFGTSLAASGGLGSLLSLSTSTSSQTQQHSTSPAASSRQTPVSSPVPPSQHSRTQTVLHSPSPPTLSLPPPPPLHTVPSSCTPILADAASLRSDRLSHTALHQQRAQSHSISTSVSSVSAASPPLSSSSLASSSSRPFTVHYSPRPPLTQTGSSGNSGGMWRTQSMHSGHTTSQLPGSRPR